MTSDGLLKQAKEQLPAACCSLALLVVILIAHPVGEVPFSDDVSFIFSAKVLARTGHIVYNGFVSPILGWQLYWGALFLRLFGDSFHVARVSISVLALFTVYLCQRTMERAGIRPWNAVVGTLVLALSPTFPRSSRSWSACMRACERWRRTVRVPPSAGLVLRHFLTCCWVQFGRRPGWECW
jgi:hypothetical protein